MTPDVGLHENVVSAFGGGGLKGCREPCCRGDESALAITSADISNIAGIVAENGIFQARIIYKGGSYPLFRLRFIRGWLISNHFHLTPGIAAPHPARRHTFLIGDILIYSTAF